MGVSILLFCLFSFFLFFPLDGSGMADGTVICKRLIDILIMGAF